MNAWPELRINQARFGSNGNVDQTCNAFIRVSGGSTGPNTLQVVNSQFNQGESGGNVVGAFIDFKNLGAGQGSIVGQFSIADSHIEGAAFIVQTDATVTILDNLQFADIRFQDNAGTAEFWNLNAATSLQAFKLSASVLTTKTFTLAPGQQINGLSVNNVKFFNPISITGAGNSVVDFEGCDYSGVTIAGSFFNARFTGVSSTGALSNTSASRVELDIQGYNNWTTAATLPTITFGGASVGTTYAVQQAQWKISGSLVMYQYRVQLSAVGSSTGAAAIAGLPFAPNNSFAATGSAVPFATGMASLTGTIVAAPVGTSIINLTQYGAGGTASITNANFTSSSALQGEVMYTS
jgi:hypothetical protein